MFGEVHVHIHLGIASCGLLHTDVTAAGDVATRLITGFGALTGARVASYGEAVQSQRFLDFGEWVQARSVATALQAGESRSGLAQLDRRELCRRLTKQQSCEDLILGHLGRAGELDLG